MWHIQYDKNNMMQWNVMWTLYRFDTTKDIMLEKYCIRNYITKFLAEFNWGGILLLAIGQIKSLEYLHTAHQANYKLVGYWCWRNVAASNYSRKTKLVDRTIVGNSNCIMKWWRNHKYNKRMLIRHAWDSMKWQWTSRWWDVFSFVDK